MAKKIQRTITAQIIIELPAEKKYNDNMICETIKARSTEKGIKVIGIVSNDE